MIDQGISSSTQRKVLTKRTLSPSQILALLSIAVVMIGFVAASFLLSENQDIRQQAYTSCISPATTIIGGVDAGACRCPDQRVINPGQTCPSPSSSLTAKAPTQAKPSPTPIASFAPPAPSLGVCTASGDYRCVLYQGRYVKYMCLASGMQWTSAGTACTERELNPTTDTSQIYAGIGEPIRGSIRNGVECHSGNLNACSAGARCWVNSRDGGYAWFKAYSSDGCSASYPVIPSAQPVIVVIPSPSPKPSPTPSSWGQVTGVGTRPSQPPSPSPTSTTQPEPSSTTAPVVLISQDAITLASAETTVLQEEILNNTDLGTCNRVGQSVCVNHEGTNFLYTCGTGAQGSRIWLSNGTCTTTQLRYLPDVQSNYSASAQVPTFTIGSVYDGVMCKAEISNVCRLGKRCTANTGAYAWADDYSCTASGTLTSPLNFTSPSQNNTFASSQFIIPQVDIRLCSDQLSRENPVGCSYFELLENTYGPDATLAYVGSIQNGTALDPIGRGIHNCQRGILNGQNNVNWDCAGSGLEISSYATTAFSGLMTAAGNGGRAILINAINEGSRRVYISGAVLVYEPVRNAAANGYQQVINNPTVSNFMSNANAIGSNTLFNFGGSPVTVGDAARGLYINTVALSSSYGSAQTAFNSGIPIDVQFATAETVNTVIGTLDNIATTQVPTVNTAFGQQPISLTTVNSFSDEVFGTVSLLNSVTVNSQEIGTTTSYGSVNSTVYTLLLPSN